MGLPASFVGPFVGLPLAGAGLGLYIYGQIKSADESLYVWRLNAARLSSWN